MSKIKFPLLISASLVAMAAGVAHADEAPTQVVVTVTREALPVSKVGQSVDVLTDKDIASYQSLSLADLLVHTSDLSLTRNGGPGAAATASIRGAGADHTLYLFDGIALNDPSQVGGGLDLGLLATDDTSRIEVLRGPLSTLWGSGALGGVVSITTRRATQPLEGDVSLEGFDRYGSLRAGIGGKEGGLTWRLFTSGQNDDGVSAAANGTEMDGFAQTHISAKVSYDLNDNLTINGLAFRTHNRSDTDGFPAPAFVLADDGEFSKSDTTLLATGLTDRFSHGEQALSLSASQTDRNTYDPDATPNFTARGRAATADYHLLYRLSDASRVLVGARYERDDMRTVSTFSPLASKSATLSSLYGQLAQDIGPASVTLSARHDEASSFGGQDIGQVSLSLPIDSHWRLHASAGQGVKIPSLYQLYGDFGTSTLRPEKALSLDGGADFTFATGQVSLSAFTREVRDLIDFDLASFTYGNIDRSKASGVEFGWVQDLSDTVHLRANYSLPVTRNESAGLVGKRLARKPDAIGNVDLGWAATQRLNLGLGLRYSGKSFDDAGNTIVLKAYGLVDLRADYAISNHLSLYGRIENLGDTRYQTAAGYGEPGRRLWLGIHTRLF